MKVLYFGDYNPQYARNRVIIAGLRKNGVKVILCYDRTQGWRRYWRLAKKYRQREKDYDMIIVGTSKNDSLWTTIMRIINSCPVVWDAFYSMFQSLTQDRKSYSPLSIKGIYYYILEWLACRAAHRILLDTNQHIEYFVKAFKVRRNKFIRVLVGSDDSVFLPTPMTQKPDGIFLVHFHGNYISLQGADVIIKTAELLQNKDVRIRMIGNGQTYIFVHGYAKEHKLSNVEFMDRVPYQQLAKYMAESDVCLGIFGTTIKAQWVIPNKVYEALAMARPVITADTLGIKELLTDHLDVLLCGTGNPRALADAILELKVNKTLRESIAKEGRKTFQNWATPVIIGKKLFNKLQELKT
jgi:glycosyltransferase involved in cell wall biosynthesis